MVLRRSPQNASLHVEGSGRSGTPCAPPAAQPDLEPEILTARVDGQGSGLEGGLDGRSGRPDKRPGTRAVWTGRVLARDRRGGAARTSSSQSLPIDL